MYTLISHRAWEVVTGDELEPKAPEFYSDVQEERYKRELDVFKDRVAKAISVIYGALPKKNVSLVAGILDPKEMWEKLRDVFDINSYPPALFELHDAFQAEKFNRKKDTIEEWSNRLQAYVRKLSSSHWPLDSRDVVHKLISELPPRFKVVRQLLYETDPRDLHFDVAVRMLQATEAQNKPAIPATAPPERGQPKETEDKVAQPAQPQKKAPINTPTGPRKRVRGGRVKKTPRCIHYCTGCNLTGHHRVDCPQRLTGWGSAGPASPQGTYEAPSYPMYQEERPTDAFQLQEHFMNPLGSGLHSGETSTPNNFGFDERPQPFDHQGYGCYY